MIAETNKVMKSLKDINGEMEFSQIRTKEIKRLLKNAGDTAREICAMGVELEKQNKIYKKREKEAQAQWIKDLLFVLCWVVLPLFFIGINIGVLLMLKVVL